MSSASVIETEPRKRLTKRTLGGTVDKAGESYCKLLMEAERLKIRIQTLQAEKRRIDEDAEAIRALFLEGMDRFEVSVLKGAKYECRRGEGRPSFACQNLAGVPEAFVVFKPRLNDAECLAAHQRGELPAEITAEPSPWVKFTLLKR